MLLHISQRNKNEREEPAEILVVYSWCFVCEFVFPPYVFFMHACMLHCVALCCVRVCEFVVNFASSIDVAIAKFIDLGELER